MSDTHYNPYADMYPVVGRRLTVGETLEAGDVYASTSGRWVQCPIPGTRIQEGSDTIWVRPDPVETIITIEAE